MLECLGSGPVGALVTKTGLSKGFHQYKQKLLFADIITVIVTPYSDSSMEMAFMTTTPIIFIVSGLYF